MGTSLQPKRRAGDLAPRWVLSRLPAQYARTRTKKSEPDSKARGEHARGAWARPAFGYMLVLDWIITVIRQG